MASGIPDRPSISTAALVDRLERLAVRLERYANRYERLRDSRCVFTFTYSLMTRTLARELPARRWDDPEWVVALAEAFARRYFAALDAYDAGRSPGQAWTALIDMIRDRYSSVLEDLVCGMAAHIVHDLPLALGDTGIDVLESSPRLRDYHLVNDALGDAIDDIKQQIERRYDPWLRWLDQLGAKHDELLTNYGIRLSRAAAWYNACRLADPQSCDDVRAAIERSPVVFVESVFRPPWASVRLLLRALSIVVSFGRLWPHDPWVPCDGPTDLPSHRYYFGTGEGSWRGTFRYSIVDWHGFWASPMGLKNRCLALGMAATMAVFRSARITSLIDGYPEQGEAGIATNDVRISLFGMTLYLLREQYVLDPGGTEVHVGSRERFGPIPFLFNVDKSHPARIADGGAHATYYIPLLGGDWVGEYAVSTDRRHIESVLTCPWGRATESIDKLGAG